MKKNELIKKFPGPDSDRLLQTILDGFQEKVDYAVVVAGKPPTLLIEGADKLCWNFNLRAKFARDKEVEACFQVKNMIVLLCELLDRKTKEVIGEGRGSAVLGESGNCKTINSTIKMTEIRAKRDAVLNTFPLRSRFTQDLEDEPKQTVSVDDNGNISL